MVWVDDAGIRPLNRAWLGRDRATDVLSFPLREGPFAQAAGPLLGDVVVSLETALRIARRRAHMRAAERSLLRRTAREIPGLRVRPAPIPAPRNARTPRRRPGA